MTGKILKGRSDFPSVFWNPATSCTETPKNKNPTCPEQSNLRGTEESDSQGLGVLWCTWALHERLLSGWAGEMPCSESCLCSALQGHSGSQPSASCLHRLHVNLHRQDFCPLLPQVPGSSFPQALPQAEKAALEKTSLNLSGVCPFLVDTEVKTLLYRYRGKETIFISLSFQVTPQN